MKKGRLSVKMMQKTTAKFNSDTAFFCLLFVKVIMTFMLDLGESKSKPIRKRAVKAKDESRVQSRDEFI